MTATTAALAKSRVTPSHAVKDMLIITKRNLRRFLRMPQLLLIATVQPVMFLLLFTFVFGGAIAIPGVEYIDFLLPGILVQTVVFGSTNTAIGLTEDLAAGVIDRFRSLPMARGAVLAGRTLADLVRSAAVNTLMIFVGYIIGFRPSGIPQLLLGLLLALMFGYSISWVFAAIGLFGRTPEAAQSASFLLAFPFVFLRKGLGGKKQGRGGDVTDAVGTIGLFDNIRAVRGGSSLGVTVDGPLGPPRVVKPGAILIGKQREFCRTFRNQSEVTVPGIHFIQEDSPEQIGQAIADWRRTIDG